MSGTKPDADERRIQDRLRKLVDGPTAEPPPMPPGPPPDGYQPAAEDTWWDDLYADEQPKPEPRRAAPRLPNWWSRKPTDLTTDDTDDTGEEPAEDEPETSEDEEPEPEGTGPARKQRRPRPQQRPTYQPPASISPRQSLLDAYDRIPPRIKWLAYHSSAAYMGWELGLVDYATHVTAWIADTGLIGPQAFFWYAVSLACVALYRRTLRWWWPTAWMAAIPACSLVTGVLLYAPRA
jgi:hypothetical protein